MPEPAKPTTLRGRYAEVLGEAAYAWQWSDRGEEDYLETAGELLALHDAPLPLPWAETVDSDDGGRTFRIPGNAADGRHVGGLTVDRAAAAVLASMLTDVLREPPTPDCLTCRDHRVVPDWLSWNTHYGEPNAKPCPDCAAGGQEPEAATESTAKD